MRNDRIKYLYFLERMMVDQINMLLDTRITTKKFLDERIKTLLTHINQNSDDVYAVNSAFFPLFSVRQLPDDIHKTSSGSGYIDNKVAKVYSLSCDLPHIINDLRLQFQDTITRNEKIAFGKLNSPAVQKMQFSENIHEFERVLKEELLDTNIPLYLKKLTETLVAVRFKATTYSFIWKFKFDPRWKFYYKRSSFKKAKNDILTDMDKYFESSVIKQLKEIEDDLAKKQ